MGMVLYYQYFQVCSRTWLAEEHHAQYQCCVEDAVNYDSGAYLCLVLTADGKLDCAPK